MGKRWPIEQERLFIEGRKAGKTYKELSKILPCSIGALRIKARRLGIAEQHVTFPEGLRRCYKCRKVGSTSNFYSIDRICKRCARLDGRKRGKRRLEFLSWLKVSVGCADCKEHFYGHAECLDFDHTREDKKFEIAANKFISLANLQKELVKCEVVCANCHRKRTQKRKHWTKLIVHEFIEERIR